MGEIVLSNNSVGTIDLYSQWIRYIEGTEATIKTYSRAVKQFLKYLQNNQVTEPTKEDVRAFRESLKASGKSSATIQNYIVSIRSFFKWTAEAGLYPNIADNVKGAKIDTTTHKKDYLTPTQINKVLEGIDRTTPQGRRDYAIILLMVTTGLRDIEVERANIEDLRPVADYTGLYIQGKGYTAKSKYVKVPQAVEDAIRESLAGRSYSSAEALFISLANRNYGERLTTRSISRIVKTAFRRVGLNSDRLTAHSLRHSCATINLLAGGSLEETQMLLRHSSINTTMIYSHALERANNNSEDRVAETILNSIKQN